MIFEGDHVMEEQVNTIVCLVKKTARSVKWQNDNEKAKPIKDMALKTILDITQIVSSQIKGNLYFKLSNL